jgi:hypothetical protein
VLASPVPGSTASVLAKLLSTARTDALNASVDVADRGAGLVSAPS